MCEREVVQKVMKKLMAVLILVLSLLEQMAYGNEYDIQYLIEEMETVEAVSKYSQSLRESPVSVTIITSDEIRRFGYRDLSDILNAVAGVYTTYDRTMSYIGVRGFAHPGDYNSRVIVLINGHPINDDIYGSVDFGFASAVDVDIISRVVVMKGPGYLYFGNNAIFAVINVITKDSHEIDGLMLSGEAGSHSTCSGSGTYSRMFGGYEVMLHASRTRSDGIDSITFDERRGDGPAEDSDRWWHQRFYAGIRKGDFRFQGLISEYDKYVPTASNETVFNSQEQHIRLSLSFLDASYSGELWRGLRYRIRGFYNSFEEKFYFPYDDPSYYIWLDHFRAYHVGTEANLVWDMNKSNRILTGLEVRNTTARLRAGDITSDTTDLDVKKNYTSFSVYGQYETHLLPDLIFYISGRYDNYGGLYRKFESVLLPGVAAVYMPASSDTFKFSYAEAYRTPSMYESFYIIDEPDGPYGNADLENERWHLLNSTYRRRFADRIEFYLNLFRYWIDNLIDQTASQTGGVVYDNVAARTTGTGGETGVSVKWYGGVRGDVSYSYQEVETSNNGTVLNSPHHMVKARLSFPMYSKFVLGIDGRYVSRRRSSPDRWVGEYYLLNTTLSALNLYGNLDIVLGIYNVFDRQYSDPVGPEHDPVTSVEQDGRTFRLELSYTF